MGAPYRSWLPVRNQVGQTTDNGLVVSGDQYINPYGAHLVINNPLMLTFT